MRVFAKAGRVVIADGCRIAKALEQRSRFEDLFGDERRRRRLTPSRRRIARHCRRPLVIDSSEVLHNELGGLRLTGSTLAANDNHLRLAPRRQVPIEQPVVGRRSDGEQVPAVRCVRDQRNGTDTKQQEQRSILESCCRSTFHHHSNEEPRIRKILSLNNKNRFPLDSNNNKHQVCKL